MAMDKRHDSRDCYSYSDKSNRYNQHSNGYNKSYNNKKYHKKKSNNKYQNKGTWVAKSPPLISHGNDNDSKSSDNKSNEMEERNTCKGVILFCGPNANNCKDIVKIKKNEKIPEKPKDCIRIICLGCTHELHNHIFYPNGDLLLHAGDTCNWRRYHHTERVYKTPYDTWKDFVVLLNKLKSKSKNNFKYGMYVIPGNHDCYLEQNTQKIKSLLDKNNIKLLINQSDKININDNKKLTLFGSPISWYRGKPSRAFQIHRKEHKDLWNKDNRSESDKYFDCRYIEKYFYHSNQSNDGDDDYAKLDILVTHGPPAGFGDCDVKGRCTGSYELLKYFHKEAPKLFVTCDYHGSAEGTSHGYGINFVPLKDRNEKTCIVMNVAIAHQPARYMRQDNIKRGVTIIDIKMSNF